MEMLARVERNALYVLSFIFFFLFSLFACKQKVPLTEIDSCSDKWNSNSNKQKQSSELAGFAM